MQDHLAAHCSAVLPRQGTHSHCKRVHYNQFQLPPSPWRNLSCCCRSEVVSCSGRSAALGKFLGRQVIQERFMLMRSLRRFSNVNPKALFSPPAIYLRWIIKEQSYIIGAGSSGVWSKLSLEVYSIPSCSMVILQPLCYNDSLYLERSQPCPSALTRKSFTPEKFLPGKNGKTNIHPMQERQKLYSACVASLFLQNLPGFKSYQVQLSFHIKKKPQLCCDWMRIRCWIGFCRTITEWPSQSSPDGIHLVGMASALVPEGAEERGEREGKGWTRGLWKHTSAILSRFYPTAELR